MPDKVQKLFVESFIGYLKNQIESQAFSADAQESVEVAVQCLQAAFDIDEEEPAENNAAAPKSESAPDNNVKVEANEIDLFEIFQATYIERNPETLQLAETIKNEGNRLMKDGKFNEALLQYNRAITYDPKNPIFYCNRAAAFIRLGENDRAVTDCKSALLYNPNYGKAYGRLGIAYANLGKYSEAQQAYSKAIELEPDNQDYQNNLEVARNAQSQSSLNAIPQLTDGLNAMLSNPTIRNLFGSAEIDLEQLQSMSHNPMVMSAIGQLFHGIQGAAPGAGAAGAPGMPIDMAQLFQMVLGQLTNASNAGAGADGDQSGNQPPPPSS